MEAEPARKVAASAIVIFGNMVVSPKSGIGRCGLHRRDSY
jgi:hypothetical protein